MMDWIDRNFVKFIIGVFIVLFGAYIITDFIHHKQLVKDYMKEFNIDEETAERRIRIDENSNKKIMYYNISTKTFMPK